MYNLKSTQKSVRSLIYLVFVIPISFTFLVDLAWSFLQRSGLTINIWGFTTFMYNNVETHDSFNYYKTLCLLEYASVIVLWSLCWKRLWCLFRSPSRDACACERKLQQMVLASLLLPSHHCVRHTLPGKVWISSL